MRARFFHYGVEVLYQTIEHSFEEDLKSQNIAYTILPILEHRIVKYSIENKTRYALIRTLNVPEEYIEEIFITERMPDDMNWNRLMEDCRNQIHKENPMEMETFARVMWDKARNMVYENASKRLDYLTWNPDKKDYEAAIIILGSTIGELLEMDHHDVPELEELINDKI